MRGARLALVKLSGKLQIARLPPLSFLFSFLFFFVLFFDFFLGLNFNLSTSFFRQGLF